MNLIIRIILILIVLNINFSWKVSQFDQSSIEGVDFPFIRSNFASVGFSTWNEQQMQNINFVANSQLGSLDVSFNTSTKCQIECCALNDYLCLSQFNKNGDSLQVPNQPSFLIFGGIKKDNTLQNDLWVYYMKSQTYSKAIYSGTVPNPRSDIQTVYYENIQSGTYTQLANQVQQYIRKFMFFYGGYCNTKDQFCVDSDILLWQYEIPFASQNYYPGSTDRGNHFTPLNISPNPGPRVDHSLIIINDFIYFFGGRDQSGAFKNDLWQYSIINQTWNQIGFKIFKHIILKTRLWDGQVITSNSLDFLRQPQEGEEIIYEPNEKIDGACIDMTHEIQAFSIPQCRGGAFLSIFKNDPNQLYLSGGHSNLQTDLQEAWIFNIQTKIWTKLQYDVNDIYKLPYEMFQVQYQKSKYLPFTFKFENNVNDQNQSENLWAFNSERDIWSQINKSNIYDSEQNWALSNYKQMISSITEGYSLLHPNLDEHLEHLILINQCDSSSSASCQNEIYFQSQDDCGDNYRERGICQFGYFICNNQYYGNTCENSQCPGSICIYNPDTFDSPYCVICQNQGSCVEGQCQCSDTAYQNQNKTEVKLQYFGDQCDTINCYSDCSGDGNCEQLFPENQCICNESDKKGGDYCEKTFCLNDCSGHGECNNGQCSCESSEYIKYVGTDCSILEIVFLENYSIIQKVQFWNFLFIVLITIKLL